MQVTASGGDANTGHGTRSTHLISCVTGWLGSVPAIVLSVAVVVVWFIGAFFVPGRLGNDTYQLVINTTTTVITFVMVFIIQNTQNRDGRAIQAKLDAQAEALATIAESLGAVGDHALMLDLVGVEDAPERKIQAKQEAVREAARNHNSADSSG